MADLLVLPVVPPPLSARPGKRREKAHRSHSSSSSQRAHSQAKRRRVSLGVNERARFFSSFDHLDSQLLDDDDHTRADATAHLEQDGHGEMDDEMLLQLDQEDAQAEVEADGANAQANDEAMGDDMPSLEGPDGVHAATPTMPPLPSPPPAVVDCVPSGAPFAALNPLPPSTEVELPPAATPPLVDNRPSTMPPPLPRAKTAARAPNSPKRAHDTSRSVPSSPAKPKAPEAAAAAPVGLFDSLSIVLVQGPELTAKRCELLTVQIVRRGGRVSSVTADAELLARDRERERDRERDINAKHPPTHALFGAMGGGYDGRVREFTQRLKAQLDPERFAVVKFLSVEWLTSCLRKNARSRTDRFEWRAAHGSTSQHPGDTPQVISVVPPLDAQPPLATFASVPPFPSAVDPSASPYAMSAASSAALAAAATNVSKRDIRYVMDSMEQQQQQSQQQQQTQPPAAAGSSVKQEPGAMLDSATLARAKREQVALRAANRKQTPRAPTAPSASASASPPAPDILGSTYVQAVPVFTDTVPYDASQYLPLSTGASYLNPDLPVAPGASFLLKPPEFSSDSGSGSQSVQTSPSRPKKPAEPAPAVPTAPTSGPGFHPQPGAANAGAWLERNKAHLACQMFSSQHRNLNSHLTGPLESLESMNGSLGDKWRTYAYRKAVGILKKFPRRISTQEDVLSLAGIRGLGGKILKKVSEIIATGSLAKVAAMEKNELIATMALFNKIHGVGSITAQKWFTWGLRTVDDIIRDPRVELSPTQKVGLQFMDDKAQRIPRLEVTSILDYVTRVANRLLPGVTVICCGSFRRGAPTSGDVDLLFTHPTFTSRDLGNDIEDPESVKQREGFLRQLLALLHEPIVEGSQRWKEEQAWSVEKYAGVKQECDRIKAELAQKATADEAAATGSPPDSQSSSSSIVPSHSLRPPPSNSFLTGDLSTFEKLSSQHGSAYYMGFCALPKYHPFHSGVNRRLDIKVYPASHFPFALLYFTGSDHFNRSMRYFAKQKKWTLSDHGLAPAIRVNGDKVWSGKSVYCATEKDVFDALGLTYVPPEQRNVYAHFEPTEEELRMLKQNNALQATAAAAAATAADEYKPREAIAHKVEHPAAASSPSYVPAAGASSSAGVSLSPFGVVGPPLKQEVSAELAEMCAIERAAMGLRRLAQEEAAILQNQLANLDQQRFNKQL